MKYFIFLYLLLAQLALGTPFPTEFTFRKIDRCTEKLPEPCTIFFKAVGSQDSITFKEGYYEIGVLSLYINQEKVAQLELSYKMLRNSLIFIMDSITKEAFRNKGLNELLRKHYIDKFINEVKLDNITKYVGSMAINYLSDYILVKNGIKRLPELKEAINHTLDILNLSEDEFKNKNTEDQIKLINESKLKIEYFNWTKVSENKNKSPWAFIYETAIKYKKQSLNDLHGSLTHLKKIER